jgi:deoxyuridine 5'-triphosphate nucleotidohydrolase
MVQLWVDGDPDVDLAAFVRRDLPALRRMAVFDAVVNNADRKGGHIIPMPDGHVYGVDHGICFSVDPKLRTLLWRWAGKPLPVAALEVLERLGVAVAVPEGAAGLVVPRSGLAAKHGISVVNGPGLIDPSYRGEVKVVLVNLGREPYEGAPGDRIAQLLLVPCLTPEVRTVDELPPSRDGRGEAGFGSSGR